LKIKKEHKSKNPKKNGTEVRYVPAVIPDKIKSEQYIQVIITA